jgi:hypothetical protein
LVVGEGLELIEAQQDVIDQMSTLKLCRPPRTRGHHFQAGYAPRGRWRTQAIRERAAC